MRCDLSCQKETELLGELRIIILGARLLFTGACQSCLEHDGKRENVVEFQVNRMLPADRLDRFDLR